MTNYRLRTISFFALLIISAYLLAIIGCSPKPEYHELRSKEFPLFIDDASSESLTSAIESHIAHLKKFPVEKEILLGNHLVSYEMLTDSLTFFQEIVSSNPNPFNLDELVAENFRVFESAGRKKTPGHILLTGYYEPVFNGSLTRDDRYRFPVFRPPDSLVAQKNGSDGKKNMGRINKDGKLVPYWTRREIETTDLLKGDELVYFEDPLDAYLLHVQGSGRVKLPDGTIRSLHFSASNGRGYRSLGKLFVDRNIMELQDVTIPAIRSYFNQHPEQIVEMLHHNPRYIFFKWGDGSGPKGSLGQVLTPGRSIAIDHSILPTGTIGYIISRKPVLGSDGSISHWKQFSRFVLPQDSGSAIKGAGRVDLFWGAGDYAKTAANHMKEKGKFYFLLKKQF